MPGLADAEPNPGTPRVPGFFVLIQPQTSAINPALATAFARATQPPSGSFAAHDAAPPPFDRRLARINAEEPGVPKPYHQFLREQNTRIDVEALAFRAACVSAAIHQRSQQARAALALSPQSPPPPAGTPPHPAPGAAPNLHAIRRLDLLA